MIAFPRTCAEGRDESAIMYLQYKCNVSEQFIFIIRMPGVALLACRWCALARLGWTQSGRTEGVVAIIGIESLTYGVDDVALCAKFFEDFGLPLVVRTESVQHHNPCFTARELPP